MKVVNIDGVEKEITKLVCICGCKGQESHCGGGLHRYEISVKG
jgi:hypothetical protein